MLRIDDPEESRCLQALAAELEGERAAAGDEDAFLFRDVKLLRFLVGNGKNVEDAATQFRAMLEWRKEAGITKMRQDLAIAGKAWSPDLIPGLPPLMRLLHVDFSERTPNDDMIWMQCDGLAKFDEVMAMPDESLFPVVYGMMELRQEHLDLLSVERQELVKAIQVRDLTGLGLTKIVSDLSAIRRLQTVVKTAALGYPETMRKIILLNAPKGFEALWALISPFLNARMLDKYIFMSLSSPADLVVHTGPGGLQALARVRGHLLECSASEIALGPLDIAAGGAESRVARAEAGGHIKWYFSVTSMDIEFSMWLFGDEESAKPIELSSPAHYKGEVAGEAAVPCNGLVWMTWSNEFSWVRSKEVQDIRLTISPP